MPQTGSQSETSFSFQALHRSSQRPGTVDSLCVPVRGTWKWNIANPKTVPESSSKNVKSEFSVLEYSIPSSSLGRADGQTLADRRSLVFNKF